MSHNFFIALRFLTAKKRAMLMSLSCTILGVGLFILTQATTAGFEDFFIRTILGTDGALRIEDKIQNTLVSLKASEGSDFRIRQTEGKRYIEGIEEPGLLMVSLRSFGNVAATSAVLRANVVVRSFFKSETAQVFGIVLEDHLKVSNMERQVSIGTIEDFREAPAGAMIGRVLADRLQITVGDSFTIDVNGQSRRYRIAAIYETGVRDIDKTRIFLHMSEARSLLKKTTGVSYIQVNLFDKDRAPQDALHIEQVLWYSAQSWQEREKAWLSAFSALRISSAVTVSVFTLIASLAMFNTLAMIVLEKTKDIAILRSMGYEREDITKIFLWQAAIVLFIGSIGGSLFGAVSTFAIAHIPIGITGIFKTDHFLVDPSPWHYFFAVTVAVIMVMVASLIPARRAARLEPGDIVRGTAQ